MNIEAKDVGELKEFLSLQFENGARWVAYQKDKESVGKYGLHVFNSCNDAQVFCDKSSSAYYQYQYTSLGKVLNALLENNPQFSNSHNAIYDAWNKEPLACMYSDANIATIEKLNKGELLPVSYKKHFIPREEIGSYHVVELSGYRSRDQSHSILESAFDPEMAKQFYRAEIILAERNPFHRLNQFLLIGEFKNCSLQFEYGAIPTDNTGLVLSMSSPIADEFGIVKHRDHKTLHELDEPAFSFQSAFAKYDHQTCALHFYNDKLERVPDLMKGWSSIKAASYDNGAVLLLNAVNICEEHRQVINGHGAKNKISGEEKLYEGNKPQKHTNKMRNKLG